MLSRCFLVLTVVTSDQRQQRFSPGLGSVWQSNPLLNKAHRSIQVIEIKAFTAAHVVDGTAPGDDLALFIQHLVPDPNDEGLCVALHLTLLDIQKMLATSTSMLAILRLWDVYGVFTGDGPGVLRESKWMRPGETNPGYASVALMRVGAKQHHTDQTLDLAQLSAGFCHHPLQMMQSL